MQKFKLSKVYQCKCSNTLKVRLEIVNELNKSEKHASVTHDFHTINKSLSNEPYVSVMLDPFILVWNNSLNKKFVYIVTGWKEAQSWSK